jgi:hypothetical protein
MAIEFEPVEFINLPSTPPLDSTENPLPKRRGRKPGSTNKVKVKDGFVDPDTQAQMHLALTAMVSGLCIVLISDSDYIPEPPELDAMLKPLENIILRRVKLAGVLSPDFNDGIMLLFGVATYGARIRSISKSKHPTKGNTGSIRTTVQGNTSPNVTQRDTKTDRTSQPNPFPGVGESWDAINGLKTSTGNSQSIPSV